MSDVCRVLVVDDEQANLDTFRRVFRREFEMVLAQSGAEALEHLRAYEFDVLIADYAMPVMNGVELLRRAAEMYPQMARLMVTAHDTVDEVRGARAAGLAVSIVPKPWNKDQILQCVATAQRMARMRQSVQELGEALKR
jgi:DNA-binding NtrC family response regulator